MYWESFSELRQRIEKLERELPKQYKALLVRLSDLGAALESQRAEIESSKNVYRLYEVAIESQRVTIESLEKLCRLYKDKIESQREAIKDCGF